MTSYYLYVIVFITVHITCRYVCVDSQSETVIGSQLGFEPGTSMLHVHSQTK